VANLAKSKDGDWIADSIKSGKL